MSGTGRREGRLRHRGAELVYDDLGEGPLAVYAHGGFVSRAVEDRMGLFDWAPLPRAGRRLVRYDARGHGRSTGGAVDADYTYESLAQDLLALLDHLGAPGPAAALGSSMGSATVLHAALREPGRFSALVLLIPPTAWTTRAAYARANRSAAETIERRGVGAWLAGRAAGPRPEVVADVPEFPPTPPPEVLPAVLRGLALSDLPDPASLATLRLPVLVLAWEGDPGHPLSTARTLARSLPEAELHVSRTRAEVAAWGERAAVFLTARGRPPAAGGRCCGHC
ncbi:alpha/beta fold hydrolase [Streptomyces sp. A1136]|uniref:alpha/beta fold hydrolase n=2 Tax=unclassified Streptomyces TaxID=2593676 RepID=UPI00109E6C39|nr:alpha/beta fold hydrolase [Streptomyces sp. A1136]THA56553.1 alpha/beta fold hydrolase [Streptomyces sp. A1136]